jgi:hypothetical protein
MRWPFTRKLSIAVKVDDEWAFQAEGAPYLVIGSFNDWLGVVSSSNEGEAATVPRERLVGFARPAAADVVEMEADTSMAEPDTGPDQD